MRIMMYVVIFAVMLASYLTSIELAPRPFKLLPEVLSGLVAVYVIIVGARDRFRLVDPKYWLLFGALGFIVACGPIVNQEEPGAIINGMRTYLRAIPFFFLPAVFRFEERDLRRYLGLLLIFAIIQIPLAIKQRLTLAALGHFTGDDVYGTLMTSGALTLFLIFLLCILAALTLRDRFPRKWFAAFFVLLVIPMSINETKITIIMLPMGLLITAMLAAPQGKRLKFSLGILGLIAGGAVIFVPLYNYYSALNNPYPLTLADYMDGKLINDYLNMKPAVGSSDQAGRVDALMLPFRQFADDPVRLTFGLGIGNGSDSSLGPQFSGRYATLYWPFIQTIAISGFMFEIGMLGTVLVLLMHYMILRDAMKIVRRDTGLIADVAPAFVAYGIIITLCLFYNTIHYVESLSFFFFFLGGMFAARRVEISAEAQRQRRPRRDAPHLPLGNRTPRAASPRAHRARTRTS